VVKLLLTSPRLCVSVVKIRLPACSVIRDWQRQHGFASLAIIAVGELQHTAVGFFDLAAQYQSNAAAAVLGGEEWNKKQQPHGGLRNGMTPCNQFILLTLIAQRQPIF
jgi:hypothetical protein